ncbi:hypothetical protein [Streptacidiphilus rugosus]|uniref:hypothetical protein n=1 Tax=Streptacidiphilus rugosus TaxID=405783 RepID=UPI00055A44F2|nr:hypothetical protein [Streptacidiphilus rugosus]
MHDAQLQEDERTQLLALHPWLRLDGEFTTDALRGVLRSPFPHSVEGLVGSGHGLWIRMFEDWVDAERRQAQYRIVHSYHTDPALTPALARFPGPEVYTEALVGLERTFARFLREVRRLRAALCPTRLDQLRRFLGAGPLPRQWRDGGRGPA